MSQLAREELLHFEQVVKIILALIVLVVVIATFYYLFSPNVDGLNELSEKIKRHAQINEHAFLNSTKIE